MCFVHFDLKMCFSPQRRAIFRHQNFKKWSETDVFCTFRLENVLFTTAACNFSTSELQKVVRNWRVLYILTWKCAFRHSGVQQNFKKWSETDVFCTFWLENVLFTTAACNFSTSELQKVVRNWRVLYILTWKCAFRHSGVQFFDIRTSKSGPKLTCFVHFDLKMCFSPQRPAIFRHQNFKKWSETGVFCTFWLENVLFATAACNFSTSELQKVVRSWRVLYILTWKCAFRHSGVQFFDIRTSKSGPKLTCFVYILTWKRAFRHSGVQFFDIRTSKSGPKLTCFVHFDLKTCFSPQRRAIFRHQNVKKCSDTVSFLAFWLQNVLFATAACNFWFFLWPHDSAPAALTGLLFDWPDTRIIQKTQHFATSLTFGADVSSFFWLSRYCILFLHSAFQLSILSEVCYLN